MRLAFWLIPLLSGCSSPFVRCDAHLQAINAPAIVDSHGEHAAAPPQNPLPRRTP
jgi:hypothetical protein